MLALMRLHAASSSLRTLVASALIAMARVSTRRLLMSSVSEARRFDEKTIALSVALTASMLSRLVFLFQRYCSAMMQDAWSVSTAPVLRLASVSAVDTRTGFVPFAC